MNKALRAQASKANRYSYYNRDANQCEIEIVECVNCQIEEPAQLSALREAGEKMARMLKYVNDMNKEKEEDINDESWLWAQNSDTGKKILAAFEAWEAANK